MLRIPALIGLGSNLGDKLQEFREAINEISKRSEILRCSRIYASAPEGFESENQFLNSVILIETTASALELLDQLLKYEVERGRSRGKGYQDRPIDLDILFYGDLKLESKRLSLPHPRWKDREFVVRPLIDLELGSIWEELDSTLLRSKLQSKEQIHSLEEELCG